MGKYIKKAHVCIVVLTIAFITLLVLQMVLITKENKQIHTTVGNDTDSLTYTDINFRGDSTSKWVKKDYDLHGEKVDITGMTIDENVYNNADYSLNGWTLRINILGDCFINQAWNGQVEIHQYVGTEKETVQQLNLQNYNIEDVSLDYLYDGDLLIPLQKGDYVIYYPSAFYKEDTLAANETLTIGTIFYFVDSIDLSDYVMEYSYHRVFNQGVVFYLILLCGAALFAAIIAALAVVLTYKRTRKDIEQQKSAVSCMSDIYKSIYLINLPEDELIHVSESDSGEASLLKGKGAREQISNMILWDVDDRYRDGMLEFTDLNTIGERLKKKSSVAREFISKTFGWCSVRIFAMDKQEGKAPEQVLFTMQIIDEEKRELENFKAKASRVETETKAQNAFLGLMTNDIRKPVQNILSANEKMAASVDDPGIRANMGDIHNNGLQLLAILDGLEDYAELQTGSLELKHANYSVKNIVAEVHEVVEVRARQKGITVETIVAPAVPEELCGDGARIKDVLIHLAAHALQCTQSGKVKISLYGKAVDQRTHLLVSVKAEGEISLDKTATVIDDNISEIGLSLAVGLIRRMNSELKIISGDDKNYELYFELDQSNAQ